MIKTVNAEMETDHDQSPRLSENVGRDLAIRRRNAKDKIVI